MKFMLGAAIGLSWATFAFAKTSCRKINDSAIEQEILSWKGREAIAFASWCSSCKSKILSTKSNPEKYILISTFEDAQNSEKVLVKFDLHTECVYSDKLVSLLGIDSLPWSKGF
jgi:hypothetical protein